MNAEGASKTTQKWCVCHFGTRSAVIWKATGRRQRGSVRVSLQDRRGDRLESGVTVAAGTLPL